MRLSLSIASLRTADVVRRAAERLSSFAEGLALSGLSDAELGELTAQRYTRWIDKPLGTLHPWERQWFQRDLPAGRCRILLGGAGAGREVHALRQAGHEVLAFDPVAPAGSDILRMSYEDLWSPVDPRRLAAAARVRAGAPYDAVVLGWSSFTHVPGAASRLRTLQTLRTLSRGPLLLSYWRSGTDWTGAGRSSLPRRAGQRLGRLLAAEPAPEDRQHDRIASHAGYGHVFRDQELDHLAAACGYRPQHFQQGFPHSTFRPIEASGPRA